MTRRWLTLLTLTTALLLVAGPALADPAGPTNYRSTIESVEPPVASVDIEIVGGDAFLALAAEAGTNVTVPGYDDEPYLRFLPDGTVERNAASPARWLNDARYGATDVTVPPEADGEAPPRWELVSTDGTYAWHDHRIHWMSPALPRQVDPSAPDPQPVTDWTIPIEVDEQLVTVQGQLAWLPSTRPVVPGLVGLAAAALAVALVMRRSSATPVVAAAGAAAAGVVAGTASIGLPSGIPVDPATVFLPGLTLALAVLSLLVRRRRDATSAILGGLAGVPLIVWVILRLDAMTAPILPTTLSTALTRSLIAVALGAGIACLISAGRLLLPAPPSRRAAPDPPS